MLWYEMLLRLVIALAIGLVIGFERERHDHPAGIKTHVMVCLGAATIAIIQVFLKNTYPDTDISRIIAQVVSGIGFIGAGCILHDKDKNIVSGLTTAATLWLSACLGIAAGLGYYMLCGIVTAFVIIILCSLRLLQKRNKSKSKDNFS